MKTAPLFLNLLIAAACSLEMCSSPVGAAGTAPGIKNQTESKQAGVSSSISLKALDLSRVPTAEELAAAGQLGGALYPTRELKDATREHAARLDFGRAIEEWNKHEYPKAVEMFRKHIKELPDSPWAAEAELHIGCDATYNGRYTEAESIFRKLIAE